MNNHWRQRLKTIEVSLTPSEVVLFWMKNALPKSYEEGALGSPQPRSAIASSITRIVRAGLKGETDTVVERGILQARREADWLYMLVVEMNSKVQNQFFECRREYWFLFAYLVATMRSNVASVTEEELRTVTLLFVNPVLVLESTVRRISAERFGGHPILFSDSAAKLKEQTKLVDEALELFNVLATEAKFCLLSKEEIRDSLCSLIDQGTAQMILLARGVMLRTFGEDREFRESFNQLAASYSSGRAEGQK